MKVFIAGASGAIGQPLVRQLVERGHAVVGMTRSNTEAIEALGAQAAVADAFDADAVRSAVASAQPDVVVNELTDLGRPLNPRKYDDWLAGTNKLRREGTKNLIDASVAAGVPKFISQSVAFAYRFDPGTKSEDSPIIGAAAGDMGEAMVSLEQQTLAGPGGIVLRYGFFYGPGTGYDRDGQQIEMIRKRQMPIIGKGEGCFPFIHVEDAAAATVAAIERGEPGIYNVVDDEPARVREYLPQRSPGGFRAGSLASPRAGWWDSRRGCSRSRTPRPGSSSAGSLAMRAGAMASEPSLAEYVAVVGASAPRPEDLEHAHAAGRRLAELGAIVVTGGRGGVMEAACRGAKEAGGLTVGILPGFDRSDANAFVDVSLPTGLGEMRNGLVARAGQAVVAIGGAWGTLAEIAFARAAGTPVFGVGTWDVGEDGVTVVESGAEAAERAVAAIRS
jgi:uncharacterized protein (TIGR00725 family)